MPVNKKAEITVETIIKILIALIVLFLALMIIWKSKDKIDVLIENLKSFLRFR